MKKNIVLALITVLTTVQIWSQVPKYALLEHFTNTRCGVCGGTNPAFYSRVNINANAKMHHISIHSSIPYSACVFYQANTAPQDGRATFYNIGGTPRVAINGASVTPAGNVTAATVDDAYCATCSPVEVKVAEIDNGNGTRAAQMRVKSVGTPPSGNYRLMVAVVEKTVNYNAPNSETVHHNVFRQFLTPTAGVPFTLPAQGGGASLVVYNYTLNAAWAASEIYVVAWLFEESTKTVLNSGTKFDAETIPVELTSWTGSLKDTKNRLTWTTSSEINTQYFDIERATDAKNFESIGRVKAAGQSAARLNYTFEDDKALQKTQYYRLKTVDLDGSFSLSKTISLVRTDKNSGTLTLFPSPTNQTLNVVYSPTNKSQEWRILDAVGKVVQTAFGVQKGQNTEGSLTEVLDVSALPNGLYFLQLIQENAVSVARFVKVNR